MSCDEFGIFYITSAPVGPAGGVGVVRQMMRGGRCDGRDATPARLRHDLRQSDEQNAKLKAEVETLRASIRRASATASLILEEIEKNNALRRAAKIPMTPGECPPGSWARIPEQMGSINTEDDEIKQEDNTGEIQLLLEADVVIGVGGSAGAAVVAGVDNLTGGEQS